MSKFYGNIGFAIPKETRPGVWEDSILEKPYYGDILDNFGTNWQTSTDDKSVNDDLNLVNEISILADPFAFKTYSRIKYVNVLGTNWKVTSIRILYPRLRLSIGGVYNGPTDLS